MLKIKVMSGGGFPEREVNSSTIGSLRAELEMAPGSDVSVNGIGVTDDYQLQEGDVVGSTLDGALPFYDTRELDILLTNAQKTGRSIILMLISVAIRINTGSSVDK